MNHSFLQCSPPVTGRGQQADRNLNKFTGCVQTQWGDRAYPLDRTVRISIPSSAIRRRSRTMWTSSTLRVGDPPGHAASTNTVRLTTDPAAASNAAISAASVSGSATQSSPQWRSPWSSSTIRISEGCDRRMSPSTRASTSSSDAGSRTQSSRGSTATGAGAVDSTKRSRSRPAAARTLRRPSSSGQRKIDTAPLLGAEPPLTELAEGVGARSAPVEVRWA